jgi:hypothetical protein
VGNIVDAVLEEEKINAKMNDKKEGIETFSTTNVSSMNEL